MLLLLQTFENVEFLDGGTRLDKYVSEFVVYSLTKSNTGIRCENIKMKGIVRVVRLGSFSTFKESNPGPCVVLHAFLATSYSTATSMFSLKRCYGFDLSLLFRRAELLKKSSIGTSISLEVSPSRQHLSITFNTSKGVILGT